MDPAYSTRFDWSLSRNSAADAVHARRSAGGAIYDLTQSNPTAAEIPYPQLYPALADRRSLRYEPSAKGLLSARQAVADYYSQKVHPDRILLTASTSEAYSYLFKLLCNPDDEILAPRPSYPLFEMLANLESVQIRQYPVHYNHGWFIDIAALRRSITARTRAIIWVNPNNPTGSYLKRSEYEDVARMCKENGLALICDEVFADYPIEPDIEALSTLTNVDDCLCFSLSGLSKVSGLPQMKLGWIIGSGPGHEVAMDRLEWIADTFLSVSTPVQLAAPALLAARHSIQRAIKTRTCENLAFLRAEAADSCCDVLRVEGGWYATLRIPNTRTEEQWVLDLLDRGVLVQPGYFFDFESEAYLIVSLLTESRTFQAGVRHILNAC